MWNAISPGFELVSLCPIPTTITITPRAPPNNYRPIICLPMMWKILTAQIREVIYYSLTSRGLFPDEQKGCHKGSRGTAKLLYIDQHILNESKNRRKNLAMAWIDYKKVYDMVPHSWIVNCPKCTKYHKKS